MVIEFWFSVGSTYTYLSVMRLAEVERKSGIPFVWRPFSVRQIMLEMDNIPFRTTPYPLQQWDTANRVAVLGASEGWVADYARATYRRWFEDALEPGSEPNLSDTLREIGQDPARVVEQAARPEIGAAYEAATEEARKLGIFGSPTFVVGRELFWGDDRLDDAIAWHRRGTLTPSR
jgi:2-hydroxychromene-2-carboxylate isomerase